MKYIIIFLIAFVSCGKKDKGIPDPAWQQQSLKMALEICGSLKKCAPENFLGLKKAQNELIHNRIEDRGCMDMHKKSNVFLLKGYPPAIIRNSATKCHEEIMKLDCAGLRSKSWMNHPSCQTMTKIQQGESL